ncbi:MAG TPA: serine--tRNA ligase, partial [Sphingomicrobium sp.]|nr:serine--tRNA ligase [Sphingomicrobium sp.]
MLALDFIKANREAVERAIRDKNVEIDLDHLLALDSEVRGGKTEIEQLRAERNAISASFPKASAEEKAELGRKAKEAGARASLLEGELGSKEDELKALMLRLPGIPYEGAPVGPDESFNTVTRTVGEPPKFEFEPLDHVALIEKSGWGDLSRVTQVSGSRTYCLKGRLALLEAKLMAWALEKIAAADFTPITVPAIARDQAFLNQGQFPGHRDETYQLPNDDLWLAGTAEVVLTSLHAGEIIEADKLPILYAGYSPCFRREAGSAGKDVRGLLRVHQFVKVEQYVICEADETQSAAWHAKLLELAESLLAALEIPYQVIETSTGDMGLGKYRMNDLESWVPSLGKYRETHSCSTLHDWQARRANIRYRGADGKVRFAHTLNNTALASPRILVPLLENHQT